MFPREFEYVLYAILGLVVAVALVLGAGFLMIMGRLLGSIGRELRGKRPRQRPVHQER